MREGWVGRGEKRPEKKNWERDEMRKRRKKDEMNE